jgi:CheY-like chemotaxis protein/two-component sensor histidine kinase
MSHELRTPLNFVLGFADLLQQGIGGELTPKQAQFVERIQSGGKHLLELVSDILDLSVVEAGKGGLQLEPVVVTPLVQEVLDLFGIQAARKRLELRQAAEPGLTVVAERRKLFQILSNLVANAVKFTSEGGHITVTARRIPAARIADLDRSGLAAPSDIATLPPEIAGDIIEISVADTGIGLAPGDLERIFRGFEQVDGSATRKHGGAGIGLALVRTLVELHGGKVRAESAGVGQGARFLIHLPILEAPPPKHVLVVEDHAPLLKTLCVFLRDAGYTVEGATTGAGALAATQDRRPDLIVLDIGLPDMDGWQVLRRLRADQRTRRLPVLVLTGLGEAQADQATALGASEFLTKPISPSALIGIVRNLLTGGVWHPGRLAPDPEK